MRITQAEMPTNFTPGKTHATLDDTAFQGLRKPRLSPNRSVDSALRPFIANDVATLPSIELRTCKHEGGVLVAGLQVKHDFRASIDDLELLRLNSRSLEGRELRLDSGVRRGRVIARNHQRANELLQTVDGRNWVAHVMHTRKLAGTLPSRKGNGRQSRKRVRQME